MKRFLMAMMCVVMALCVFGCGQSNSEKYSSLKKEVMAASDKTVAVSKDTPDILNEKYVPTKEDFAVRHMPFHERNLKAFKEIHKEVMPKLKEMEKLALKDPAIAKDWENFGPNAILYFDGIVKKEEGIIKQWKL